MAKYYIIYETKNLKNGMIYIGMHETTNIDDGYLGSGKRLKRAIRYYGEDFFERKVLHVFDNKEDMIAKEVELVNEEFINRKDTYNLKIGGEGGFIGEEHYKKMRLGASNFAKNQWKDPIFREKQIKLIKERFKILHAEGKIKIPSFKGKKHTEETKIKMSETKQRNKSQQGSKNSQYGTCWIYNIKLKENKKIKKEDLNYHLTKGWVKGRKIK